MSRFWIPAAAIVLLSACARSSPEKQVEAAPKTAGIEVRTARAETRTIDRAISVTGELQPDETLSVVFEVGGRVAKIHTDFGRLVRKGEVIAELDPTEYRIQVERGQALLAQALARIGLDPEQANATPTTSPAIRQAEAQLADARSKFESAAKLVQTGDIAQERYLELEKAVAARQAALDAARDDLRTQLASVQSLKADLRLIEKRLADTVVRAPFDAAVTERLVSPGQYIKENTPVLRLVKSDPLRLRADIPEAASSYVKPGSTITFTTDAAPGETFRAAVERLNPALDKQSRSMSVEAKIANPKWTLRPGTFVQVQLITERNVPIVTVPKSALYSIAGLTKAFAVRDGKAVEIRIPPGTEGDGWVEAPKGSIAPGELVAVSNLASLIDQAPVISR
jgi:RND family efflux transporter MFP subunit